MKTEMKMLDNGNYEAVPLYIQHKCNSEFYEWTCTQYSSDMSKLILEFEDGDPYEDGCSHKIDVAFCPFCGYKAC
jgi:hypothetical protein